MELDVAIASDSEKLSEHEIHRIESAETKAVSFSQAFHMSLEMKRLLEERIKMETGWTASDGSFLQRCGSYNEVKFVAFDKRWVVRKFLLIFFFWGILCRMQRFKSCKQRCMNMSMRETLMRGRVKLQSWIKRSKICAVRRTQSQLMISCSDQRVMNWLTRRPALPKCYIFFPSFLFPPPLLGVCVLTSLSSWSPKTTIFFNTDI